MKAKTIAKTIKESYGTGFSMTGGMTRGTSGRGSGFGGASNLGGPNMMYTYSIVPLNTVLQQKHVTRDDSQSIHIGLSIRGKKLNDNSKRKYSGHVIEIKKADNGSLKYYSIIDKTGSKVKINPSSATIVDNTPLMADLDTFGDDPDIERAREKGQKTKEMKEGQLVPESLDQLYENLNESHAYQCTMCGERAEHEEIDDNPHMKCGNCGNSQWEVEHDENEEEDY